MRARGRWLCAGGLLFVAAALAGNRAEGQGVPVPIPDPEPPPADSSDKPRPKDAVPTKTAPKAATLPVVPPTAPLPFALQLRDGSRLVGVPAEIKTLPFHAAFGRVEIPLSLIKSIAFAAEPAASTIGFHNGDRLTGAVSVERMRFQTAYGAIDVPLANVIRLTCDNAPPPEPQRAPPPAEPKKGGPSPPAKK